jgi:hypothetical protein
MAFEWFLGRNHLAQVMYNRVSGGCYDGLEEHSVNLNQGAESTVCYLLARTTMERSRRKSRTRALPSPVARAKAYPMLLRQPLVGAQPVGGRVVQR